MRSSFYRKHAAVLLQGTSIDAAERQRLSTPRRAAKPMRHA